MKEVSKEELKETIENLADAISKDYDIYDMYKDMLSGNITILQNIMEGYFMRVEGLSCCADKAAYTIRKVFESIDKKQNLELMETYPDDGKMKEHAGKRCFWVPLTIKDTNQALSILFAVTSFNLNALSKILSDIKQENFGEEDE